MKDWHLPAVCFSLQACDFTVLVHSQGFTIILFSSSRQNILLNLLSDSNPVPNERREEKIGNTGEQSGGVSGN